MRWITYQVASRSSDDKRYNQELRGEKERIDNNNCGSNRYETTDNREKRAESREKRAESREFFVRRTWLIADGLFLSCHLWSNSSFKTPMNIQKQG